MSSFPFVGQAYTSRSLNVEAQECINLFLEIEPGGRTALFGTPGLSLLATIGTGPVRALHKIATGDLIAVSGAQVYRITSGAVATLLGTIGTTTGPVSIADNGTQAVIVDGSASGYQISLPGYAMTPIVSTAFYGADNVYFLDGRFIFNRPGTGQFYLSDLYAVTFDPLYFATAESSPDNLIAHIVDHREIWLFGNLTTEIWSNTGGANFPYERLQGAAVETGCAAAASVRRMDNSIVWLGQDDKGYGIVWMVKNYMPARISTHAIEYAIASYGDVSNAIGYVYQQEGHMFYMLTFPTVQRTWCYDVATHAWHQRAWMDSNGQQQRHRSNCHAFAYGKNLVGDFVSGNIYALDMNTFTDAGDQIRRSRSCAPINGEDFGWQQFHNLQIEMEGGVGLIVGQGSNPQAMLTYSDDGGHQWSSERLASMGVMGQYRARVRWTRLGRSRDRVFRVTISDPVKVIIINASINQSGT